MDRPGLYSEVNDIPRKNVSLCLNEYASKIKWSKSGGSVIDLGCGDGSVTSLLNKYVPKHYEKFYACDINQKMVDYANEYHGDENIKFIVQDVEGELSIELKSAFDNVFSFFLFHWILNQEKGFRNVYELLKKGGECFLVFFGYLDLYHAYDILARTPKWGSTWIKNIDGFVSPYYNVQDPEKKIKRLMEDTGFSNINVVSKKTSHTMENALKFSKLVRAVDPYNMPDDVFEDFYTDFIKTGQDIGFIHKDISTEDQTREITMSFTLYIVHATKP